MKKTIIIALTLTMVTLTATAQQTATPQKQCNPSAKKEANKWMCKKHEERKNYIIQQMQLTDKEKTAFTAIYDFYRKLHSESTRKMKTATRQLNDSCTDAQYEKTFQIINNERSNQANYDANLYESMKKILPMHKIYLYYKADREFNKLMMRDMTHRRKKSEK